MGEKLELRSELDILVSEILRRARRSGRREIEAWKQPRRELRQLAELDYMQIIRPTLDRAAVHAIVREARKIWPYLNREQLRPASPSELVAISSGLRIHLQARPYRGNEGMALRGFYVDKSREALKRPLIYVNTAHHPGAVQATFVHEMGHHVTARVTGAAEGVRYFFHSAHADHLDQPHELAADVIVSLAAYPQPLARKLFESPWDWKRVARADKLPDRTFRRIRKHMRDLVGIDFGASLPPGQSFNYLTGMIHYAKLRWALLAEYGL